MTNFLNIKQAFLRHFASALSGVQTDPCEAVSQYLVPDLCDALVSLENLDDISSTAKSSNVLSAAGLDIFKYYL